MSEEEKKGEKVPEEEKGRIRIETNIPEEVLQQLRERAKRRGEDLMEYIGELLHKGLGVDIEPGEKELRQTLQNIFKRAGIHIEVTGGKGDSSETISKQKPEEDTLVENIIDISPPGIIYTLLTGERWTRRMKRSKRR